MLLTQVKPWFVGVALLAGALGASCKKEEAKEDPAPKEEVTPSEEATAPAADAAAAKPEVAEVPTPEDFEEDVVDEVTEDNVEAELKALEESLDTPEPS